MNILEKIILNKRKEVAERKTKTPHHVLEKSDFFKRRTVSLKKNLCCNDKVGIIAEIKRQSPSRGMISTTISLERTAMGYLMAGASGLSIVTDLKFFGGKDDDLITIRRCLDGPILRKEFIVNEYQIIESKALGADAILLLANVLEEKEVKTFTKLASSLGLEVLLEIHDKEELKKLNEQVDMVGVNNRNLKDFSVDVHRSYELAPFIPNEFTRISESGISLPQTIYELKQYGFKGFLIGEHFMKESRPDLACAHFIQAIETFHPVKILAEE